MPIFWAQTNKARDVGVGWYFSEENESRCFINITAKMDKIYRTSISSILSEPTNPINKEVASSYNNVITITTHCDSKYLSSYPRTYPDLDQSSKF